MKMRKCGGCGYDLMGISVRGQCPECGRSYDVATGRGTDARARHWAELYFRTIVCGVLMALVMLCSGLFALAATRPMGVVYGGMSVGAVVLLIGLYSYMIDRQAAKAADEANR
ncbi:MAG: hypothetical protein ACIAXF_14540 [Phycisphaerales bacterium JB063]